MLENVYANSEQGRLFHNLADQAPIIVWAGIRGSTRIYVNPCGHVFAGQRRDLSIRDWLKRVHRTDRARLAQTMAGAAKSVSYAEGRFRVRGPDGHFRWLAIAVAPWRNLEGQVGGVIGTAVDVSLNHGQRVAPDVNMRALLAREEERQRIARELHDGVCQRLALLLINLRSTTSMPDVPAAVVEQLRMLWDETSDVAAEIHRVSRGLHPSALDSFGLPAALRNLCTEMWAGNRLYVEFLCKRLPTSLPRETALAVYRTVQEALQNVVKHSGAPEASVELWMEPGRLHARVADRGRGFLWRDVKSSGLGFSSIKERLTFVGGSVAIQTGLGRGTSVTVEVPLRVKRAAPRDEQRRSA